MLQESPEKFVGGEGHLLGPTVAVVAVAEGHGVVGAGDEGAIGDGRAVNVAAEVAEDRVVSVDHGLGVDDPARAGAEGGDRHAREHLSRRGEKLSGEEASEWLDGHEEAPSSTGHRMPGAIGSECAARHDHVNVRVVDEGAGPGVEHGEHTDLAAQVALVGGELGEGGVCRAEEDVDESALMLAHEPAELGGQGEDDVVVGNG